MIKRGMPPTHPGAVLREMFLEPLSLTVTELAARIGVARRTVSLLINEHTGVSAEMALRLSRVFGTTPELWMNMQQKYDLWNAERTGTLNLGSIKQIKPKREAKAV